MVANKKKFKGKMAENEYSQSKLAKELGLTPQSVGLKINSKDYEFTLGESIKIKELWDLTDMEYLEIFIYA